MKKGFFLNRVCMKSTGTGMSECQEFLFQVHTYSARSALPFRQHAISGAELTLNSHKGKLFYFRKFWIQCLNEIREITFDLCLIIFFQEIGLYLLEFLSLKVFA